MAHEACLITAYTNGVTQCSICHTPYPVTITRKASTRCKKPKLGATLRATTTLLCIGIAAIGASLTIALVHLPPDGVAIASCIIFVALILAGIQINAAWNICLQRTFHTTTVTWTTTLAPSSS